MTGMERRSVPMSAVVDSPAFAPLRQELRAWVEERLAEAVNPGRGRRLKGLPAVLAKQVRRMPARERRELKQRYRPTAGARRSLADRLSALAERRPQVPLVVDPLPPSGLAPLAPTMPSATFEVTRITCVESTSELSADEIYMTLFSGGPVGAPVMLGPRKLGDFRNGDTVDFSPPIATEPLAMQAVDGFQTFLTVGYCAEVDRDEYFDLMQVIYQELLTDGTVRLVLEQSGVRDLLLTILPAEVMLALFGAALTVIAPVVGVALIVGAVAAIVGGVLAFWSTDEMFTIQVDTLQIPVTIAAPPTGVTSPAHIWSLTGYGAVYELTTRWRLA